MLADSLLIAGKALFAAIGFASGFRLRRLAKSGEGLTIHALAAGVIFLGGAGVAATALTDLVAPISRPIATGMIVGGDLLERIALVGLCIFLWKVFRPAARWALAAGLLLTLALLASLAWEVACQPWPGYVASLPSAWSTQLTFALPFVWAALETASEWSRGRRKLALGLIAPIAVERFAVWSLAAMGFVGICVLGVAVPVAAEAGLDALSTGFIALRAVFYFVVAASIWIAMFEPGFYVARFSGEAAPSPDA